MGINRVSRRTFLAGGMALSAGRRLGAMQQSIAHGLDALLEGGGFVRIPAGEFVMGSDHGGEDERPQHRIHISHAFEIGRVEVTQAQWQAVIADPHAKAAELLNGQGNPVSATPSHFKGPSLPVESVSWYDIELFLRRLNQRDAKHNYRLPSEAEWEYACVAGAPAESLKVERTAWYKGNAQETTHPAGEKPPNTWGLYDTIGNVAEWVQDWYAPDYYERSPATDPLGPPAGSYRVFRSGSWIDDARYCRPMYRRFDLPLNRLSHVGFRLVRVS